MRRTGGDEAGIGGRVARRRGARQPAWFRRKADIATASEWAAPERRCRLLADGIGGASENRFNTIPTILTAFPPRLAAFPKPCSDPRCRSNPIAHRVRRKRLRLPPSLLIENASDRHPRSTPRVCAEAFPIKASDDAGVIVRTIGKVGSRILTESSCPSRSAET